MVDALYLYMNNNSSGLSMSIGMGRIGVVAMSGKGCVATGMSEEMGTGSEVDFVVRIDVSEGTGSGSDVVV